MEGGTGAGNGLFCRGRYSALFALRSEGAVLQHTCQREDAVVFLTFTTTECPCSSSSSDYNDLQCSYIIASFVRGTPPTVLSVSLSVVCPVSSVGNVIQEAEEERKHLW